MKSLVFGTIIAAVLIVVCPSMPEALAGALDRALRTAQLQSPWGSNAALERMIREEQQRLRTIRDKFGQWRAIETCRADIAEFERFAAANGTPYVRQTCS